MKIALRYYFTINWKILLADIFSGILLIVFLYTSLSKFRELNSFRFVLEQSSILKPFAYILYWLLPLVEFILAVLLFIPATRVKAIYFSLFLLALFIVYLSYMLSLPSRLRICNCGGIISSLSWEKHILLNFILLIMGITALILYRSKVNKENKSPP